MEQAAHSKQGKINVQAENIFPIIKKFLYSDHEIFLRELVSNAVDAVQKLKTLSSTGEYTGNTDTLDVQVQIHPEEGTLTISDKGIGMTEEEVEKYLNQVAFSGATEFLEKYKGVNENSIIGHFGLGFYSAFMVSSHVEVITRSFSSETAVKWSCDGSPEYSLSLAERDHHGTDIVLHIAEDSKEFLEPERIREILEKYGKFLPVNISFEGEVINNPNPAWKKKPADLTDEAYSTFYKELYPSSFQDPLFHIHLNVDYPFNLTGILYFPKHDPAFEPQRNKIQLYSNQVFITDAVEGVVPEFLMLLHGVLDSPDIPLNVSRSYLQADGNVKKISGHITKKVTDKLTALCKENRADFEQKWDDIKIFILYGYVTDEKFAEKAGTFTLVKNNAGQYFLLEEYLEKISALQKDKDGNTIILYTHSPEAHHSLLQAAAYRGYDVLCMDSPLDAHFISRLESKLPQTRFARIDSDSFEKMIDKGETLVSKLNEEQVENLKSLFTESLSQDLFQVQAENLGETDPAVMITQPEFLRRMNEMNAIGGGNKANLFGMHHLVINTNHPAMLKLLQNTSEETQKNTTRQLIDLAMLEKGLLKGEALADFIKRSTSLLG